MIQFHVRFLALVVVVFSGPIATVPAESVPLGSLDLTKMTTGWGSPQADKSVSGKPLAIGGRAFARGVGTHAPSALHVQLDGRTTRFRAEVGVDDATEGRGSLRFEVFADGRKRFDSGPMKGGDSAQAVDVDLTGVRALLLLVTSTDGRIDYDHADWADAVFETDGAKPVAVNQPEEPEVILTPPPGPAPRINGPAVLGGRPGRPFLYRIPCTGTRPIAFSAESLPEGITLDSRTGILRGTNPAEPGRYRVTLAAANAHGADQRELVIVVGDTLALTPPMGWNHWYTFYADVSDKLFRDAADAMVASGMADFGYAYVNIDDCWMRKPGSSDPVLGGAVRDARGVIRPNGRFPDMKALTDYIHAKGLKAGIYTSPGPMTCAGYAGAYEHEELDARTFADWGFDFLKYDWCHYASVAGGNSVEHLKRPYKKMGDILARLDRDVVYNLCQYGMGDVWTWGGEVGGHSWRTTHDLGLRHASRLPGFYYIGLSNAAHHEYAKPGQWNDPDYILIGTVGNALVAGSSPARTTLSPSEQYSYMSMWCLMAAPLFYSGDMTRLDPFTLGILCNAEVIDVDQDPLGKQARIVRQSDDELILAKPMKDGSLAVGLFNLGEAERSLEGSWSELDRTGPQRVRDLWRQKDLDQADGRLAASVPRHGVLLVRLWRSE